MVANCVEKHESDHIDWFKNNDPDRCKGKCKGKNPGWKNTSDAKKGECRGYKEEVKCLDKELKKKHKKNVYTDIKKRIKNAKSYANKKYGCGL